MQNTLELYGRALIIGYVWPEPESSAAGLRTWNLIHTFQKAGLQLLFASPSKENTYTQRLRDAGISTFCIAPNDPKFDLFLQEQKPDFVVFDRFVIEEQFGWRVQEQCPETIRILDTQDLHFLRRRREQLIKSGGNTAASSEFTKPPLTEDALRELASIYRCDSTLVLSSFEKTLLIKEFKISPELLFLSRFHYNNPPSSPGFYDRKDFVWIGNFRHPPNADGIKWLYKEIWPLIRKKLPEAQVFIYGAYPPKEMMNLSNSTLGFHVMGHAPNQFETLQKYRINLAPLRFGAGIKGKITDGWWSGTPVVTTQIGAEGMSDDLPWGGIVVEDTNVFAEQTIALYTQEERWNEAQSNGYQLIQKLYNSEINSKSLISHLRSLKENIQSVRTSNIVGSILNYHAFRSTKYFSKWIEEKSKTPLLSKSPATT